MKQKELLLIPNIAWLAAILVPLSTREAVPDLDVYSHFLVSGDVFLNVSEGGSFFGFYGHEISVGARALANQELISTSVSQPCRSQVESEAAPASVSSPTLAPAPAPASSPTPAPAPASASASASAPASTPTLVHGQDLSSAPDQTSAVGKKSNVGSANTSDPSPEPISVHDSIHATSPAPCSAKNPYKKDTAPEFPVEQWEAEAYKIQYSPGKGSDSTLTGSDRGVSSASMNVPSKDETLLVRGHTSSAGNPSSAGNSNSAGNSSSAGNPNSSINEPSKEEILLAVEYIYENFACDPQITTPCIFYGLISEHFNTQVKLSKDTKKEVINVLANIIPTEVEPSDTGPSDSQSVSKKSISNPSNDSKSKAQSEPKSEHDVEVHNHKAGSKPDAGDFSVFELGTSQLGPSQPIISVNKKKNKKKRRLRTRGQSRHSEECTCMECDPDNKKKDRCWSMPPKIDGYFESFSPSYRGMKLTPRQRATQRRIALRNQRTTQAMASQSLLMQEDPSESRTHLSGLARAEGELTGQERPQVASSAPVRQTGSSIKANRDHTLDASWSDKVKPQDSFHSPSFQAKSFSFIESLETRAKSGELHKKRGRKARRRTNFYIDDEAESSDENKYESGSLEDHGGSDQEEDVRSDESNLNRDHSHDSDDNNEGFIDSSMDNYEGRDLSSLVGDAAGHQDSVHSCALLQKRKFEHENKRELTKKLKRDAARENINRDRMKRQHGNSLLGRAIEVTPENGEDHLQYSLLAVGSKLIDPLNLENAMEDTIDEGGVEREQRTACTGFFKTAEVKRDESSFGDVQRGNDYGGAFKTAENERDVSGGSEDDEGLKEKYKRDDNDGDQDNVEVDVGADLVDTDDERNEASVDSIGIEIYQRDKIVNAMNEAPHIFWGFQDRSLEIPINCVNHFILPRDMLVFFDDCVHLDVFCGDESEIHDVYGINHSLVCFDACTGTEGGSAKFMFDGDVIAINQDKVRNLFVKVYRQDERGQWRSAFRNNEKPWQGWLRVSQLKADQCTGNDFAISSEMRESAEKFMVEHFKPAYQRFVRSMRKWNAMYVNSLGLRNQSMRPSIENECNQFNVNRFRYESPGTLARIASHIGNGQYGEHFDRRSLSLLYILLRHFNGKMLFDNK